MIIFGGRQTKLTSMDSILAEGGFVPGLVVISLCAPLRSTEQISLLSV